MNKSTLLILVLSMMVTMIVVPSALADQINQCGNITVSGTYNLTSDLTVTSGICLNITASNVILNGNGHKITATSSYVINTNSSSLVMSDLDVDLTSNDAYFIYANNTVINYSSSTLGNRFKSGALVFLYGSTIMNFIDVNAVFSSKSASTALYDSSKINVYGGNYQYLVFTLKDDSVIDGAIITGGDYVNSITLDGSNMVIKNSNISTPNLDIFKNPVAYNFTAYNNNFWATQTSYTTHSLLFLFTGTLRGVFYNNTFTNFKYLVQAYSYFNLQFYNNKFVDIVNVFQGTASTNFVWNTTKQLGTPIDGSGSYIGGNYWSGNNYGFSESDECIDLDHDGICDSTYTVAGKIDYLPLTNNVDYPISSCQEINVSGDYFIVNDLVSNSGDCLVINADNVTLNGGSYSVSALSGDAVVVNGNNFHLDGGIYNASNDAINDVVNNGNVFENAEFNAGHYGYAAQSPYNITFNNNIFRTDNAAIDFGNSAGNYLTVTNNKIYVLSGGESVYPGLAGVGASYNNVLIEHNSMNNRNSGISLYYGTNINIGYNNISAKYVPLGTGLGDKANQVNIYNNNITATGSSTSYGVISDMYVNAFNNIITGSKSIDNVKGIFYNNTITGGLINTDSSLKLNNSVMGNYWVGFSDNTELCVDANQDGICDSPYTISGLIDYLPLTNNPFISSPPVITVNSPYSYDNLPSSSLTIGVTSTYNISWCAVKIDGVLVANETDVPDLSGEHIFNSSVTTPYLTTLADDGLDHVMTAKCENIYGEESNEPSGISFTVYSTNNAPIVTLSAPTNNQIIPDSGQAFTMTVTDDHTQSGMTCDLYVDDSQEASLYSVNNGSTLSFNQGTIDTLLGTLNKSVSHEAYVTCYDSFNEAGSSSTNTFLFTQTKITNEACPVLTYPNEANLPSVAQMSLTFSLYAVNGFSGSSVDLNLSNNNGDVMVGSCSYVDVDSQNRDYTCNVSVNYWYDAGQYDLVIGAVVNGFSDVVSDSNFCEVGQLIASQRVTPSVGFSSAAPGISDSLADNALQIKNTGNVPLDIKLTAYDLKGRSEPNTKLFASYFKAGASLGTSVALEHGVQKSTGITITNAEDAESDIWLWLSMPSNQMLQDYYAATPWQVIGSAS